VNNRSRKAVKTQPVASRDRSTGTLEAIASGFSEVLAKPYLIIVPLVIDLMLWLGVQISIKPFTEPFARLMQDDGGANGPEAAKQVLALGNHVHLNELAALFVPSIFAGLSKENVLNWLVTFLAPPLAQGVDRDNIFSGYANGPFAIWSPPHWFAVITIGALLFILATFILVLFRVPVARAIASRQGSARDLLHEMAWAWLRLVGLLALTGVAIIGILVPALIVAAVLLFLGINIAIVIALALFTVGGMAAVYSFFVLDAMLLLQIGPIDAIRTSFSLVRGRFGECFRFAMICVLIQSGILHVWQVLIQNPPGFVIALLANAFIGTGIAAATMIFFTDRFRLMDHPKGLRPEKPIGFRGSR